MGRAASGFVEGSAALILAAGILGCPSISAGTRVGGAFGANRVASAGPAVQALVHTSSEGFALGAEGQIAEPITARGGPLPWRTVALAGYSVVPLPFKSRVGFDAQVLLGAARAPVRAAVELPLACELGARFAMPLRITRDKLPWTSDTYTMWEWSIVPEIATNGFVGGASVPATFEIQGGLSLRFQFWSGIAP